MAPQSEPQWAEMDRALAALEAELGADPTPLAVVSALKKRLPGPLAQRAAELFDLRRRARARFPSGRLRWLTRKGLEQATREVVARARAQRIAALAPRAAVHDLTCGLGADALELSLAGLPVLASDRDPLHAQCARANLAASPNPHCVFVADAAEAPSRECLVLLDPDRRPGASSSADARALDPHAWSPAPEVVARVLARAPGACIKLPAGFDIALCPTSWIEQRPHSWEWVSAEGELCEVNLWLGSLAGPGAAAGERDLVTLGASGRARRWSARPESVVSTPPQEVSEISWVVDPDPALVRSGLLEAYARAHGLRPLGPQCAYLVGRDEPRAPLGRAWHVLAQSAADPKLVRKMLGDADIGPIQVLKRGHPLPAEELERRFRGRGRRRGVVLVARLERGHLAFLVEPGGVGDEGFEPPTSSL